MQVDQSTGDIVSPSFAANLPNIGYAMSFDPSGDLWLSDSSRILEYGPSGNLLRTITNPSFNLVFAAVFNPPFNTVYAGDLQTGDIFSYDLNGNLQNTFNVGSGVDGLSVAGTVLPGTGGCSTAIPGTPPPTAAGATVNVAAIEVNQVVQDWCDSVPLIQGKPTLVRVHLQNTTATAQSVAVVLQGSRNGTVLGQLHPVNPGNTSASSTSVTPSQNPEAARGSINSTANFLLPTSWESGTVTLTALPAQGQKLGCADPTSQPSACTVQVTFKPSPTLHLTLVEGSYPDPNGSAVCRRPDLGIMNHEIKQRLYEIFPVAPGHIDAVITVPTGGPAQCLTPTAPAQHFYGGPLSWQLDSLNGPGAALAEAAWQAAGRPSNRFFITVLATSGDAWYGTSGENINGSPYQNAVWYIGNAPPYSDPWFASRYEIGHELMHAMGLPHPGAWIDDAKVDHQPTGNVGLCGTPSSNTNAQPSVAVDTSTWQPYSFTPGIAKQYQYPWPQDPTTGLTGYPNGRAYALGPMIQGPDSEIWGLNVDAFQANDLPQRIVINPHDTFDMMSYCYGTYGPSWAGGASKFQWITASEYETVLSKLGSS